MLQYSYSMIFTLYCVNTEYSVLCLELTEKPIVVAVAVCWPPSRSGQWWKWWEPGMIYGCQNIKLPIEVDNGTFPNVASISLPTTGRLLKRHHVLVKHIYLVPFERNNDRVKQLRAKYVQVQHYILYYWFYLIHCLLHMYIGTTL